MIKKHTNTNAFTLIELSIVVVIIGLIVAGVVAGQSLVKQAKLRTMLSEIEEIKTICNTFKLQYNAVPGDMTNAYDFWGSNCDSTASNCNGDGDGLTEYFLSSTDNESYRGWQHLSLSGLIPESYAGIGFSAPYKAVVGYNIKGSSAGTRNGHRVGYWFQGHPNADLRNRISVSGESSGGIESNSSAFTPQEGYQLDSKIDDGIPTSGILQANGGLESGGSPWDSNCWSSNAYNLNLNTIHCNLHFGRAF